MKVVRLIWLDLDTVRCFRKEAEASVGAEALAKSRRFRQEADQLRSLGGAYLIRRFVGPAETIRRTEKGKPLAEHIFFNLSHAGRRIGLALAETAVGLDLEPQSAAPGAAGGPDGSGQDPAERQALKAFCLSEKEQLSGEDFLSLFVSKEALVKACGSGLPDDIDRVPALPLNGPVSYEGQLYFRHQYRQEDEIVSVCLHQYDFMIREETIHAIR